MVSALAEHHGDAATLTDEQLYRDAFGPAPWITLLVADSGGGPIGYAVLVGLIRLQFGLRGMDLHHLYVEPAFRAHGIGRALVMACQSEARRQHCGYLTVSTHPDNSSAQKLYLELGFTRRSDSLPRFQIALRDDEPQS